MKVLKSEKKIEPETIIVSKQQKLKYAVFLGCENNNILCNYAFHVPN